MIETLAAPAATPVGPKELRAGLRAIHRLLVAARNNPDDAAEIIDAAEALPLMLLRSEEFEADFAAVLDGLADNLPFCRGIAAEFHQT